MDVQEVEHTLTKKAGPLPVWGWGVAVGGILVVYLWYMNRGANSAASTGPVDPGMDPAGAIDNAGLFSGNDANAANATYATQSTQAAIKSNVQWLRMGVQYETGKGRNALVVSRALQKYLNSQALNQKQDTIVSDVLTHVGLPPHPPKKIPPVKHPKGGKNGTDGTGGGGVETPPTKPPIPKPVRAQANPGDIRVIPRVGNVSVPSHTYTTAQTGDSPASVAHAMYGAATPGRVAGIAQANSVGERQEFVPGQIVRVPRV